MNDDGRRPHLQESLPLRRAAQKPRDDQGRPPHDFQPLPHGRSSVETLNHQNRRLDLGESPPLQKAPNDGLNQQGAFQAAFSTVSAPGALDRKRRPAQRVPAAGFQRLKLRFRQEYLGFSQHEIIEAFRRAENAFHDERDSIAPTNAAAAATNAAAATAATTTSIRNEGLPGRRLRCRC